MASQNSINFTGRLGSDPELRALPSGGSVCRLSVALDRFGDKPSLWIDVSVFGKQAEPCARFLAKGREVAITGRVDDVRAFQKRNGEPGASLSVAASDVTFVGGKGDDQGSGFTPASDVPADVPYSAPAQGGAQADDDIPF